MENYVTIFGLTLPVNRVAFTIPIGGGFDVYWYGIIIALGFVLALVYAFRRAGHFGLDKDRMMDVVLVSTIAAILGARLYYLAFDDRKITGFSDIIGIKNGGLAIYGGIIGAFLAGLIMCRVRKVNVLSMFDLAGLGFLIGQAVGRWGNFVNQEAYGGPTGSSWWGMTGSRIQAEMGSDALVHPCFLYESLWCAAGFVLLHLLSRRRKFKGEIFLGYVGWYSFGRFFIEGLRTDSLHLGAMRVSQLLAAILFVASAAAFAALYRKSRELSGEDGYLSIFAVEELDGGDALAEESDPDADDSDSEESEASETSDPGESGEFDESADPTESDEPDESTNPSDEEQTKETESTDPANPSDEE